MRRLANVILELGVLAFSLFVFHFIVDPYALFGRIVPLPQVTANPSEFIDRLLTLQPKYNVEIIGWRGRRIDNVDAALAGRAVANLLFTPAG